MRRLFSSAIPLAVLLLAAIPTTTLAQEIEAPSYTPEQRWERAATFATLGTVSAIAYVKSSGQSLDEYYEAMADLFVPGWGEPGTASLGIMVGFLRNFAAWPDCEYEIVEQSEDYVTARLNRPWTKYFGEDQTWYGVTLQEYEAFTEFFNLRLAEYKGLGYEQWTEGEWMYVKFSRGS